MGRENRGADDIEMAVCDGYIEFTRLFVFLCTCLEFTMIKKKKNPKTNYVFVRSRGRYDQGQGRGYMG